MKICNSRNNEKFALNLYMKTNNLDQEDQEDFDPAKLLQPVTIEIAPEQSSLLMALLSTGQVNLMQLRKQNLQLNTINVEAEIQSSTTAVSDGAST